MSTELPPVPPRNEADRPVNLMQFCGPVLGNTERRTRLAVTPEGGNTLASVSPEQAVELAHALLSWAQQQTDRG